MKKTSIIAFLVLHAAILAAQDKAPNRSLPAINADLPDETEETDLLEKGSLQAELAYLYTGFDSGVQPSIGQALIRYGLSERLELRALIEDGRGRDRYMEETAQSTAPLAVGAKLSLLKDHAVLPDITLVGYLKLPFTSRTRTQLPYWSPNVSLAFQHQLSETWKLEYNAGVQQQAYSTDWAGFVNASLHYKTEEGVELFAEYYSQYQNGEAPKHNAGLGLFMQVNKYAGFYLVGGRSIHYQPVSYFVSGGIVLRFAN